MLENIKAMAAEMATYHTQFYGGALKILETDAEIKLHSRSEANDLDARFLAEVARVQAHLNQMSLLPRQRQAWRQATDEFAPYAAVAEWIENRPVRQNALQLPWGDFRRWTQPYPWQAAA